MFTWFDSNVYAFYSWWFCAEKLWQEFRGWIFLFIMPTAGLIPLILSLSRSTLFWSVAKAALSPYLPWTMKAQDCSCMNTDTRAFSLTHTHTHAQWNEIKSEVNIERCTNEFNYMIKVMRNFTACGEQQTKKSWVCGKINTAHCLATGQHVRRLWLSLTHGRKWGEKKHRWGENIGRPVHSPNLLE